MDSALVAMQANGTAPGGKDWGSAPSWKMPGWFEPVMIASILIFGIWMNRRRSFTLIGERPTISNRPLLPTASTSSLDLVSTSEEDDEFLKPIDITPGKKERRVFGLVFHTPDNNQFANTWPSRFLFKFPFLVEVGYWLFTYLFYLCTKKFTQAIFTDGVWDIAQANAIRVLDFEHASIFSFLFPIHELDFQQWFLGIPGETEGHHTLLTCLNRFYALIHIPGTVYFICWFYKSAPSHAVFAVVRRTITLTNWFAFVIFMSYPCMPPRLLPASYGFIDTVRRDSAESVLMKGKFVNSLAAMPSMHFGYSFIVGMTLIWHSGVVQSLIRGKRTGKLSKFWMGWFLVVGLAYPTAILVTIVATANHYWLDACAGGTCVVVALCLNRVYLVFQPVEDWFCRVCHVKKPKSNAGQKE